MAEIASLTRNLCADSDCQTLPACSSGKHTWQPIAGERGQYACACGATGFKARDGKTYPHQQRKRWPGVRKQLTARPTCGADGRREARIVEDFDGGREWDQ